MPLKGRDFFKHHDEPSRESPPADPQLPECTTCELTANPSWGDIDGSVYCPWCVPDHLRFPALRNKENQADGV